MKHYLRRSVRLLAALAVLAAFPGAQVSIFNSGSIRIDDTLGPEISTPPPGAADQLKQAISTQPGQPRIYVVDAAGTTSLTTISSPISRASSPRSARNRCVIVPFTMRAF